MTYYGVSSVMERNKFEALFRNIHFVNNLDVDQEKKRRPSVEVTTMSEHSQRKFS